MVFICDDWFDDWICMVVFVGPMTFHLYGLLIGLGILVGAWVGIKVSRVKADEVWDGLLWVVGPALVGARVYHVIDYFDYYWLNPGEIVMLWRGGMGIFGGVLGGLIGLWIWPGIRRVNGKKKLKSKGYSLFTAINKKKFLRLLDVAGVGLPIGQAIGRWGNYFNQELYGKPTGLPWGIKIRPENRLLEVMDYEKFHPLFLYEGGWSLVGFFLLWWLLRLKKLKMGTGGVLMTYLGWYGLGRFWLEFLKIEVWEISGMNVAQVISAGLVVSSVYWLQRLRR